MPFLAIEGLSKRYAGVVALDRVSLHVDRGEWLAVAGENGAGKSTLMKILAGLETRDAGSIVLDGEPVALRSVRDAKALETVGYRGFVAPNPDVESSTIAWLGL